MQTNLEEQQLGELWNLYIKFRDSGDERGAKRLFKLLEKKYKKWQAACFCGHFSAGKSTLLNTLLSEDLLPTSPIPTSGNLVRLEPGDEQVRVVYKNGETAVMNPPYSAELLKEWCKNTEEIDEVRIQMGDSFPPNWMLFDTPGVDATDRDHQAATEDAVFLADSMIFVADYNHLQSEANFNFLDRVQRLGKPIYLVVNQIDKHQDQEISFDTYKWQIENSLKDWGLHIERIFYLSLTNLDHPYNEWEAFKTFISELSSSSMNADHTDLDNILEALISDHKEWWTNTHVEDQSLFEQTLSELQAEDRKLKETHSALSKEVELDSLEEWLNKAKAVISRTIESAVLTPYETRELAKTYLEALQPEFKVGFFSTRSKVQKVQHERLVALLDDLSERLTTLNWQTGDTFYKVIEPLHPQKEVLKSLSQSLQVTIDETFIKRQINEGARITGAYILTFADKLAQAIQKVMRQLVQSKLDELKDELTDSFEQRLSDLRQSLAESEQSLKKVEQAVETKKQEHHHFNELDTIFNQQVIDVESLHASIEKALISAPVFNLQKEAKQAEKNKNKEDPIHDQSSKDKGEEAAHTFTDQQDSDKQYKDDGLENPSFPLESETLLKAAKLLQDTKGFKETATDMIQKLERLEKKSLTIALFGAFSAGKSSFANALLGESVLKVSPHPTTAVVNRILPTSKEHPHGEMVLYMKSEEALMQDLHRALKPFGQTIESLDDLSRTINTLPELGSGYSKGKLYFAFLKAVSVGLTDARPHLGTPVIVDLKTGQDTVADETKACLIDRVDLYYDCEATRKGMILVDTPGADSLNARHTETSYKYIQSADAVVFVTYYQHAFSRADETFLRQLGRIQDVFDRDKFFFIVNAIDLARNKFERDQVTGFVTDQLKQLGIQTPRLFGVSSLEALKAKQASDEQRLNESGFSSFMADWDHFVSHDLIEQALTSVQYDLERSTAFLDDFIEKGQMSDVEREAVLRQLSDEAKEKEALLQKVDSKWLPEELDKTTEELIYYVKQRLSLQLTENFSRFFNPSVLRQDRGSKQALLSACLEECLGYLSNELEQEVRATAIRVEANLTKMLDAYQEQVNQSLGKQWAIPKQDAKEWISPSLPYDFIDVQRQPLEKPFRLYKNPKQFFEENGIKTFKEELLNELEPAIRSYMDDALLLAKDTYHNQLDQALTAYQDQVVQALHSLYDQKYESIKESKVRQAAYLSVQKKLNLLK